MTALGCRSSMRTASSLAAKPPNTTECTAPSRAHASIAIIGFRHHGHVDDHAVALRDSAIGECPGEAGHFVAERCERVLAHRVRHGGVVHERHAVAAAHLHVPVERVRADVEGPIGEPPVDGRVRIVEGPRGRRDPVDRLRGAQPERVGVICGVSCDLGVGARLFVVSCGSALHHVLTVRRALPRVVRITLHGRCGVRCRGRRRKRGRILLSETGRASSLMAPATLNDRSRESDHHDAESAAGRPHRSAHRGVLRDHSDGSDSARCPDPRRAAGGQSTTALDEHAQPARAQSHR